MNGHCPACIDQISTSPVIKKLNTGPVAQAGVKYTVIETRYEFVVTPAGTAAFIKEPGVRNIWLQDHCPFSVSVHSALPYDKGVQHLTMNALDSSHAVHCS